VLFGYLIPARGRVVLSVSVRGFECERKRLFCLVENSVVLGLLALHSGLAGFNARSTPRAQASLVDLIIGYFGQRFFADRGAETPARRAGVCSGGHVTLIGVAAQWAKVGPGRLHLYFLCVAVRVSRVLRAGLGGLAGRR
tara:strand:+ start:329 stop:748 length:420 start_codon:yes stop_codon:yes gene_type:complete